MEHMRVRGEEVLARFRQQTGSERGPNIAERTEFGIESTRTKHGGSELVLGVCKQAMVQLRLCQQNASRRHHQLSRPLTRLRMRSTHSSQRRRESGQAGSGETYAFDPD
jgi:hypothetical protein